MCFFLCGENLDEKADLRDGLLVTAPPPEELPPSPTRVRIPIYKKVSRRQCPLIDYTWERQWQNVVARCHSHPSEAACVSDHSGRTALHLASFNHGCPNYVAHALIHANPHALAKQDSYGQTPLHYATQFRGGTNELVVLYCQKLIEFASRMDVINACPAITASPLYLACLRNAPITVLNALVCTRQYIGACWIAPITGGEPYWDHENDVHVEEHGTKTPLSVLIDSYKDIDMGIDSEMRQQMKDATLSINEDKQLCQDLPPAEGMMAMWLKCLVLLREHLHTYARNNDGASLLHLVASLKVPVPVLVECCALVFPEKALQRDHEGYVPLHYALLNPPCYSVYILNILLRNQPEAAALAMPNGRSPLVVALQQQRVWWHSGLQELVMADPDALERRDSESGLYPFQMAACLDSNVTIIYGLLRLRPDLC